MEWFLFAFVLLINIHYGLNQQIESEPEDSKNDRISMDAKGFTKAINIAREMCTEYSRFRYKNFNLKDNFFSLPNCYMVEKLIPNPKLAEPKEFPHMALIGYKTSTKLYEWVCSGSLISSRFILTAAECGANGKYTKDMVAYFRHLTGNETNKWKSFNITRRYDYQSDNESAFTNNSITLLELSTDLEFDVYLRPICLSTLPSPEQGDIMFTSGWKLNKNETEMSEKYLYRSDVNLVNIQKCSSKGNTFDSTTEIFANEQNAFTSDIGSPLQIQTRGEFCLWSLAGVSQSHVAAACEKEGSVARYISIYKFIKWIQKIVWPNKNNYLRVLEK